MATWRGNIDNIPDSALECLNGWPKGTLGHQREQALLANLNQLAREHGYGRLGQVVKQIEDIWREGPEVLPKYQEMRSDRLEAMELCRKTLEADRNAQN